MNTALTPEQVAAVMETSRSEEEWDKNCDLVKTAFGGNYPPFWFDAVLASGVARRTMANFGASPDLTVSFE